MRFLARAAVTIAVNIVALLAAEYLVPAFHIEGTFQEIALVGLVLTVLNVLLRPILKLIFGPVILLTFGLGILVVNALVLYVLDLLSQNLYIESIPGRAYASIVISIINLILHLAI